MTSTQATQSKQTQSGSDTSQVRIGIAGLSHGHVNWILNYPEDKEIEVVGIVEPNKDLARRFSEEHGFPMSMVYDSMESMIEATHPEAVTAFGSIYEHLEVVQKSAPHGIHVMVEKPLAVNMEHARQMKALADRHDIHLITNYETTWYPTNHKAFELLHEQDKIGELRKVVAHHGHWGPEEIGVYPEFLNWLTDPKLNGGGALIDFGCYGVNLITWLMDGQTPISVTALTQTMKPEIYPEVDDEATILLEYPQMQGIVQASWNWPLSRKDMELYGATGKIISHNRSELSIRTRDTGIDTTRNLDPLQSPYDNPFSYLAAVVRGEVTPEPHDLSSLGNNMTVVRILDAARESAKTGKRIPLK